MMMFSMNRQILYNIPVFVLLVNACSHGGQADIDGWDQQDRMNAIINPQQSLDPAMKSQVDIRMRAAWIDDDSVRVILQNISKETLGIYYRGFGIITSSERIPRRALPSSRRKFPEVALKPGAKVAGELDFPGVPNHLDARIVFVHPDTVPAIAEIH